MAGRLEIKHDAAGDYLESAPVVREGDYCPLKLLHIGGLVVITKSHARSLAGCDAVIREIRPGGLIYVTIRGFSEPVFRLLPGEYE